MGSDNKTPVPSAGQVPAPKPVQVQPSIKLRPTETVQNGNTGLR